MLRVVYFIFLLNALVFSPLVALAQSDQTRASVVKVDGVDQFSTTGSDKPVPASQQVTIADGFSYYSSSGGVYMTFTKANNNVKLFALTGQLLWSGELVSGKFFVKTGEGIYFLRVNNKSYKVISK